ncbi:transposase [Pseudomonas sp. LJDD11]|uniref:transposase n=1 Tax=Pseudomonas sp. LJDD11 TaxID=2931984 RepID=UPI00211B8E9C|nr:transposase [Pseudomonas sp. LJDD11]MCQ9422532.1 transposase [Pseudomonas sp. LJDD11]
MREKPRGLARSRERGRRRRLLGACYTTQTCSCCGSISTSSPKGRAGLQIREWTCVCCGTAHDRDVNAARNILAAGHRRLAVGIPAP